MRFFICVLVSWFLFSCSESPKSKVYVRLPQSSLTPEFIKETNFNRDSKYDDYYAFGYVERQKLNSDMKELDDSLLKKYNFNAKTLELKNDFEPAERYENYHNYTALTNELKLLEQKYPNLIKMDTAGKSGSNRELWYVKISQNVQTDGNKPNLLYIANMHGDETVGRELMIYLIRELVSGSHSDLIANAQIFIMPSMNPDGFELNQRYNANGTDLNRSFPDFTSDPNDITNNRAPEIQAIMRLMDKYHFQLSLNFHGGEVCYNLVWDTQENVGNKKFPEDAVSYKLGRDYTLKNKTMYNGGFDHGLTYGYEWYEVNGGMQDWATYYRQSIQATVELSGAKYPSASELPGYWNENKDAFLEHITSGLKGLHFEVVDSYSGRPLYPKVTVSNRKLIYRTNFIHRLTLDGEFDVTIEAEGYKTLQTKIKSSVFNGTFTKVNLIKN